MLVGAGPREMAPLRGVRIVGGDGVRPMSSVLAGLSQVFARSVAGLAGHAQSDCGGVVFRVVAGFAVLRAG